MLHFLNSIEYSDLLLLLLLGVLSSTGYIFFKSFSLNDFWLATQIPQNHIQIKTQYYLPLLYGIKTLKSDLLKFIKFKVFERKIFSRIKQKFYQSTVICNKILQHYYHVLYNIKTLQACTAAQTQFSIILLEMLTFKIYFLIYLNRNNRKLQFRILNGLKSKFYTK